jgi:hypothetical protein
LCDWWTAKERGHLFYWRSHPSFATELSKFRFGQMLECRRVVAAGGFDIVQGVVFRTPVIGAHSLLLREGGDWSLDIF